VLLVGGYGSEQNVLSTAEVYDPETSVFSATGEMKRGRKNPTLALLKDGRVLIAGGCRNMNFPCSRRMRFVDIWDPSTGEFSEVSMMNESHWGHTATALQDGRVLVVGGYINNVARGATEVYDPTTDSWELVGHGGSRFWHSQTTLQNGDVLLVGGARNVGAVMNAEIFRTADGDHEFVEDMKRPRARHTATLLKDGRVLVVGGGESLYNPDVWRKNIAQTAEIFDPATGGFTSADSVEIEPYEPPMSHDAGEVQRKR